MTTPPPEQLLTVAQLAEQSATPGRTIRLRALRGDLPYVVKVPGKNGAYLFDPSTVEMLRTDRSRRRHPSNASAALSALVLPPAVQTGLGWLAAVTIAGMIGVGLREYLSNFRPATAAPAPAFVPVDERHASAIASATIVIDPVRGRVLRALGVEFWRSAYGQWVYEDAGRVHAVEATAVLRALETREAGWSL